VAGPQDGAAGAAKRAVRYAGTVIVRILTARVAERNAPEFEDLLRRQLPRMRQYQGLLYLKLARQVHPGYEDVLLFEEWRDAAALYEWAGEALERPRLLPGAEALAEDVRVTHYEALDLDPDAMIAVASIEDAAAP